VLLAASLAANGLFAYRLTWGAEDVELGSTFARRESRPRHVVAGEGAAHPELRSASGGVPCEERLQRAEAMLRQTEEEVEKHLSPDEGYSRGGERTDPPPDLTRILDRMLSAPGFAAIERRLECRGRFCRLDLVKPASGKVGDTTDALQQDRELRTMVDGIMFGTAIPQNIEEPPDVEDLARRDRVFLIVSPRPRVQGLDIVVKLVKDFGGEVTRSDCRQRDPGARGRVDLQVELTEGASAIKVYVGGSLGLNPVGLCYAELLRAMARTVEIPPAVRGGVTWTGVEVK